MYGVLAHGALMSAATVHGGVRVNDEHRNGNARERRERVALRDRCPLIGEGLAQRTPTERSVVERREL
jgi:hypothetical protein